ncbi:VOC family protein [Desertihabitans aurantiacus]|uniref:VOC family protein n=1 Tax=Desertihabitans aurantiacus TaxID=2282477 RepID=UPI000DF7F563|nr:VOC family protein [Desertihabitans aurantiacus]
MEQRLSLVTLAVDDLEAVRRFWVEGIGWQPMTDVPGEVVMFQVGEHLLLSLWDVDHFTAEVGAPVRGPGAFPITLAHNLGSPEEVDAVLAQAERAGARTTAAEHREWGGYSGYFVDPAGFSWEIAWAPGEIGALVVPPGRPG